MIMTSALYYNYCSFICRVYYPVLLINAHAAISTEITLEPLSFSISTLISVTHDILQQFIHLSKQFIIRLKLYILTPRV